jgi:ribonuclease HI
MIIYTDGACKNNGKANRKGGCGVFFGDNANNNSLNNSLNNISVKLDGPKITNQVAELTACILAIEAIINNSGDYIPTEKIIIKTDSMYTINCITTWFEGWKKRGWKKADGKPVDNLELIKKLHSFKSILNIEFIHVRAHKDEPPKDHPTYNDWYGNMMADKLATSGANS